MLTITTVLFFALYWAIIGLGWLAIAKIEAWQEKRKIKARLQRIVIDPWSSPSRSLHH